MANNLIKNETHVFYTVKVNDDVVVSDASFYGGKVDKVEVSRTGKKACEFNSKENGEKIALCVAGKLIRHTRTEVITETTEVLEVDNDGR